MAVLIEDDRRGVWKKFIRDNDEVLGNVTKADLRAAVDAIDSWLEANAVAMNQAIPVGVRGNLTVGQKARLFAYVMLKRWGG